MVTESATLAFAKYTITFEAVPPGQLATKIRPTAKKGGRSKRIAKIQPKKGITVNCKKTPKTTHFGVLSTWLKSLHWRVSPMPNIIPPKP